MASAFAGHASHTGSCLSGAYVVAQGRHEKQVVNQEGSLGVFFPLQKNPNKCLPRLVVLDILLFCGKVCHLACECAGLFPFGPEGLAGQGPQTALRSWSLGRPLRTAHTCPLLGGGEGESKTGSVFCNFP